MGLKFLGPILYSYKFSLKSHLHCAGPGRLSTQLDISFAFAFAFASDDNSWGRHDIIGLDSRETDRT